MRKKRPDKRKPNPYYFPSPRRRDNRHHVEDTPFKYLAIIQCMLSLWFISPSQRLSGTFKPSSLTMDPSILGRISPVAISHIRVNIILKLNIVPSLSNPGLQKRDHCIMGTPPISVHGIKSFSGSFFNFPTLHKHQGNGLLNQILFYGLGNWIIRKIFEIDLAAMLYALGP